MIPEEENLDRKEFTLAYRCDDLEEPVFLHGKSVFAFKARKEKLPEWIVYQEVKASFYSKIYQSKW